MLLSLNPPPFPDSNTTTQNKTPANAGIYFLDRTGFEQQGPVMQMGGQYPGANILNYWDKIILELQEWHQLTTSHPLLLLRAKAPHLGEMGA